MDAVTRNAIIEQACAAAARDSGNLAGPGRHDRQLQRQASRQPIQMSEADATPEESAEPEEPATLQEIDRALRALAVTLFDHLKRIDGKVTDLTAKLDVIDAKLTMLAAKPAEKPTMSPGVLMSTAREFLKERLPLMVDPDSYPRGAAGPAEAP